MITEELGNSPRIKIIEFLIDNRNKGYSIVEIMEGAKVKHRTLIEVLKDLLNKKMIYIERKIGKSYLYKIDKDNDFIESLILASEKNKK